MDSKIHSRKGAIRHEQTSVHRDAVAYHISKKSFRLEVDPAQETEPALRLILDDMAHDLGVEEGMGYQDIEIVDDIPSSSDIHDDFLSASRINVDMAILSQALLEFLDGGDLSDQEMEERSDDEDDEPRICQPYSLSLEVLIDGSFCS